MRWHTNHRHRPTGELFPDRGHLHQQNIVDNLQGSSVLDLPYQSIVCSAQSTRGEERDIHARRWQRLGGAREELLEPSRFGHRRCLPLRRVFLTSRPVAFNPASLPSRTLSPSMSTTDSPKRTASPVCVSLHVRTLFAYRSAADSGCYTRRSRKRSWKAWRARAYPRRRDWKPRPTRTPCRWRI